MHIKNTDGIIQSHVLRSQIERTSSVEREGFFTGVSRTGAKFTPNNHKDTGDRAFDLINSGDLIEVEQDRIEAELRTFKALDVKYIHEHARNPVTHEQSADTEIYKQFAKLARSVDPSAMLSFGASRNGAEISQAIKAENELARTRHAALPFEQGGAEFVTSQAAIELQIVTDLERQGFVQIEHETGEWTVLRDLRDYVPSGTVEGAGLEVHSTTGGGNYGSSSAAVQLETLKWSIARRRELGVPFEVEWVQHGRSSFLTWFLVHGLEQGLSTIGRLNITLLFGFSPKLPFPKRYSDFKRVVNTARSVPFTGKNGERAPLKVSIAVGAAVLPHHALQHVCEMDVGPLKGQILHPMERLVGYAAMADSGVDILRVGMEDTPFLVDRSQRVVPASNSQLVEHARELLNKCEARVLTDPEMVSDFTRV